jgi:hypothetical protein
MLKPLLFSFFVSFTICGFSQYKTISAVRSTDFIKVDGELNDAPWQQAPLATEFIQNFPVFGIPASTKSDVRILYDDNAIYIGAYLFDDPELIRRQLTTRDNEQGADVDYFSIFLDTYNDLQNGYQFLVTTENVQTDAKLTNNSGTDIGVYGDKIWDAVWESKTSLKKDGWVVEMRIPYISLRFSKKEVQTWGLQFLRFTRRNNETAFWNAVDPNTNGFVNQFGKYTNLKNIQPPLRLSFSPYLSGGVRFSPDIKDNKAELLRNGGMDVKYGINESFTVDATIIPDFGQVVSDNIINNLSPFEVRFRENRPFFTEGTELFNKAGLFYSRRIGTIPAGYNRVRNLTLADTNLAIIRNPSITQLYNAIKLSGRTSNKLGIGIFNAVTAPMKATLRNSLHNNDTLIITEPLANYNLIVLDQAFKGRSSITFSNANVIRNSENRDANVSAFDWALYNKTNLYALSGTLRYSKIFGYTPYTSAYFFNTDTIRINGRKFLNPYDGYNTRLRFGKVSGKMQYFASTSIKSSVYDPNDLGFLTAPNEVAYQGGITYNQFTPTKKFLNYNYSFNVRYVWLYKPYKFSNVDISTTGYWVLKNFWNVRLNVGVFPTVQNDFFDLRTWGYYLRKPWYYYTFISGSTDNRKKLFANYELGFATAPQRNNPYYRTNIGMVYRFSNRFTLNLDVERQQEIGQIGYSFLRQTNGEPIAGIRDYIDMSSVLSGTYNFNSRMNFTLRARHYWSVVEYENFYNVKLNGLLTERPFISGQDQNFNIFNLDAFFTWDFRAGSRIIAGWKNWLGNEYVDGILYKNYLSNYLRTFDLAHGNELTLKVIYFLDYNQLRRE